MTILYWWTVGMLICLAVWYVALYPRRRARKQREEFRRYLIRLEQFDVERAPAIAAREARSMRG